jgi:hypothetical protein
MDGNQEEVNGRHRSVVVWCGIILKALSLGRYTARTMLLCKFPEKARYDGAGDRLDAARSSEYCLRAICFGIRGECLGIETR